uniref:Uncharacterized protein n=1 Tax=Anopheles maculatus TaxID=74869 RepID=A0A182SPC5_9DIPT
MLQRLDSDSSGVKAQQNTSAAVCDDSIVGDRAQSKSKKELRQERKKRKLLGLSALMMLNEQEGIGNHHGSRKKNPALESDNNNPEKPVNNGLNGHNTTVNGDEQQQLRQILVKNRTAYNIGEECDEQELPIEAAAGVDAKRRKVKNGDAAEINDNAGGGGGGIPSPVVECRTLAADKGSATLHSDTEYRTLKAFVNQRKSMRYTPRILLKPSGHNALLDRNERKEERI